MNFGLQINKKDLITIVVLCIVFFSIAVVNLGNTQYPSTTAQMTNGQGFYIDLGAQTNVNSMIFLLDQGALNLTISSGSPGNWTVAAGNVAWPYSTSSSTWSEDYNKWYEVSVDKTTQYLKVDFNTAGSSDTILSEIAVLNQN